MQAEQENIADIFYQKGFLSPVPILSREEACSARKSLEAAEADQGPLHYKSKIHTVFPAAADLATSPVVLDVVEKILGPDILLFDVSYIIKEPNDPAMVCWHQDLTYWGFSGDQQVSMWLALSPANAMSGCMRMIPGSHKDGKRRHRDDPDDDNMLHRGQRVDNVGEEGAVLCPLHPGEASFHHGWTLHASMPNRSSDRRIGLNVQYITPEMKQLVARKDSALLVRGQDSHGHYLPDQLALEYFSPADVARHARMDRLRKQIWEQANAG